MGRQDFFEMSRIESPIVTVWKRLDGVTGKSGRTARVARYFPAAPYDSRVISEFGVDDMAETTHEVVIVGGGFGGLYAACMGRLPVRVTFWTAAISTCFSRCFTRSPPGRCRRPIRGPATGRAEAADNTRVLLAEVTGIDVGTAK